MVPATSLAMHTHLREIVRAPGYLARLLPLIRPLWRRMTAFAPGQMSDDNAITPISAFPLFCSAARKAPNISMSALMPSPMHCPAWTESSSSRGKDT